MEWRQAEEEAQDVARTVEDLGAEVGRRIGEEEEEEWQGDRGWWSGGGMPGGGVARRRASRPATAGFGGGNRGQEIWMENRRPGRRSNKETRSKWKMGGLEGVAEKLQRN